MPVGLARRTSTAAVALSTSVAVLTIEGIQDQEVLGDLTVFLASIASSPTQVTLYASRDAAGDEKVGVQQVASITTGKATSTDGTAVFTWAWTRPPLTTDKLYLHALLDAGTATATAELACRSVDR